VVFQPYRLERRVRQSKVIASNLAAVASRPVRRAPGAGPHWPSVRSIAIGVALLLATFLIAQAWLDPVATLDPRTLPAWIGSWIGKFSAFGKSGWILWPAVIALLSVIGAASITSRRIDRLVFTTFGARLLFVICAVALPGLAVSIVKPLIGRVRPFVNGHVDPFAFQPLAYFRELFGSMPFPEYFYGSMPSGHTANAVAIAVAIGALMPRLWPWLAAFAVTIAASRLAIGVHHATDVLAGALLGGFGALAIRNLFAARRLAFAVGANGDVYAMPGPSLRRLAAAFGRLIPVKRPSAPFLRSGLAPGADR
jgi:undecaprenyl-diphosphatase